jgi:hypothetical protein
MKYASLVRREGQSPPLSLRQNGSMKRSLFARVRVEVSVWMVEVEPFACLSKQGWHREAWQVDLPLFSGRKVRRLSEVSGTDRSVHSRSISESLSSCHSCTRRSAASNVGNSSSRSSPSTESLGSERNSRCATHRPSMLKSGINLVAPNFFGYGLGPDLQARPLSSAAPSASQSPF